MNIEYKPKLQFLQKLNIWFFAFIQDILKVKMEKVGLENNSMIAIYEKLIMKNRFQLQKRIIRNNN